MYKHTPLCEYMSALREGGDGDQFSTSVPYAQSVRQSVLA